jgi:hypothetical protein
MVILDNLTHKVFHINNIHIYKPFTKIKVLFTFVNYLCGLHFCVITTFAY